MEQSKDYKDWLELEVLPLLLDMCKENSMLIQQEILNSKFFNTVKNSQDDFYQIIFKAFDLRPSNWIILSEFYDDFSCILNQFKNGTEDAEFDENSKNKYSIIKGSIKYLILNDLESFLNIEKEDFIKNSDFAPWDEKYFTKNYENIPIILLSALFGSYKVFNYFLNKSNIINIKSDIEDDLIRSSIIGGNHKILVVLKRLNFEISKHIDAAAYYHRNDIFMWIINQYKLNIDKEYLKNKAHDGLNFDLFGNDQIKGYISLQDNALDDKTSERNRRKLKRGGKRPHNYQ